MLGEGGVQIYLDPQPFSILIDNYFVNQLPEIGVADLTFLYDFLNQIDS
jgi:hypothetical protein